MTITSSGAPVAVDAKKPADWRGFWRVLLAVVAPIPGVALAISNFVTPGDLAGSATETLVAVADDQGAAQAAQAFSLVFLVFLVPSGVAMLMAMRRVAPRAATIVVGFVTLGFCAGVTNPRTLDVALIAAREDINLVAATTIMSQLDVLPTTVIAIIPFALTITLGRIALGVVLWRTRIAPRWMAVAMLLAGPVEWGLGAAIGNLGPAVAYLLTAIGFASASWALLHMSNGEFDLPPLAEDRTHVVVTNPRSAA